MLKQQTDVVSVFDNLSRWVASVLGDIEISTKLPDNQSDKTIVSLYLKAIEDSPSTGALPVKNRLQLILTYLVMISGADENSINMQLLRLAFSAMRLEEMFAQPVFTPLPAEEWRALGLVPKPSFLLRVPVNHQLETKTAKYVKQPLVIDGSII